MRLRLRLAQRLVENLRGGRGAGRARPDPPPARAAAPSAHPTRPARSGRPEGRASPASPWRPPAPRCSPRRRGRRASRGRPGRHAPRPARAGRAARLQPFASHPCPMTQPCDGVPAATRATASSLVRAPASRTCRRASAHMAKWVCPSTKPGVTRASRCSKRGRCLGAWRSISTAGPTARIRPSIHQSASPATPGREAHDRGRAPPARPPRGHQAPRTVTSGIAFHMLISRRK